MDFASKFVNASKKNAASNSHGCRASWRTRFDGASNNCQGQQVLLQPANKKNSEKKKQAKVNHLEKKIDKEELQNHELKDYQQKKKKESVEKNHIIIRSLMQKRALSDDAIYRFTMCAQWSLFTLILFSGGRAEFISRTFGNNTKCLPDSDRA